MLWAIYTAAHCSWCRVAGMRMLLMWSADVGAGHFCMHKRQSGSTELISTCKDLCADAIALQSPPECMPSDKINLFSTSNDYLLTVLHAGRVALEQKHSSSASLRQHLSMLSSHTYLLMFKASCRLYNSCLLPCKGNPMLSEPLHTASMR